MDNLLIKDLLIFANHGVFDEEKKLGQKFLIDIDIKMDLQKPALSKDLNESINYGLLAREVYDLFKKNKNDLIETCAEQVAQYILNQYTLADSVKITVKKPWAPIGLPLDTVAVTINRKKSRVFLGIGSNMGDRERNLSQAMKLIESDYIKIKKTSSIIETKAWGLEDQADFLNQVIEIQTSLLADQLLRHIQEVENIMGRKREIHWGPRIIDIDILFFDNDIIYTDDLKVPHPYIEDRLFVLEPLNEIAPFYIHPVNKKQVRNLYNEFVTNN